MTAVVGVIMGSRSDWETMRHACETLEALEVPFEQQVVSAHRTPDLLFEYAGAAEARGLQVLIAGAGGAAHLPGMAAAKTALPVTRRRSQPCARSGTRSSSTQPAVLTTGSGRRPTARSRSSASGRSSSSSGAACRTRARPHGARP